MNRKNKTYTEQFIKCPCLPFVRHVIYEERSALLKKKPLEINKILILIILFIGCRAEKLEMDVGKRESNVVEESLNKMILVREEMGFIGEVKAALEYEFDKDKWSDNFLTIKGSKYHSISADSSIKTIRDVLIKESHSYRFDNSGRLIQHIRFAEDDGIYMEEIENYVFDNKGRIKEWNNSEFDNKMVGQKFFKYDEEGRLIELTDIDVHESLVSKTNINYLQDTIEFLELPKKGEDVPFVWRARYDKYGELIEDDPTILKEFDDNGKLIKAKYKELRNEFPSFSIIYDYDVMNNKVRETKYDSIDNLVESKMFFYNKKNEMIQKIEIDSIGTDIKQFDIFGNEFQLNSVSLNESESTFYGSWENYDRYENVTKRVDFWKIKDGKLFENITRFDFEYDEYGNWILRKVFENDSLTVIFERKLIYY